MDHVSYQYDYASNRRARDISSSLYATNNLDQTYGYDSLHRLKNFDEGSMSGSSIASPTKEQDWSLDTLGNWNNLTEKASGSTTLNQNRGHNNANELTTIAGASTYVGHDAAGNMTKVPKPTSWSSAYDLEFDAWNRLVRVKDGGATVASYSYDGLHRRIVKTVGATTEQHYYNEQLQLLEVRVGTEASAARQKYVWHPYYIDALAQRFWDGNSDGDFLDANEKHFVMHDGNFNVTSVMTTGGSVFERYFYSPYGKFTVLDSNFAVDSDGISDVANPYTYTGRQFDAESGLYQYRYRYYHAQLGRFVGKDPAGYEDYINLFVYIRGNPPVRIDSNGAQSRPSDDDFPLDPDAPVVDPQQVEDQGPKFACRFFDSVSIPLSSPPAIGCSLLDFRIESCRAIQGIPPIIRIAYKPGGCEGWTDEEITDSLSLTRFRVECLYQSYCEAGDCFTVYQNE